MIDQAKLQALQAEYQALAQVFVNMKMDIPRYALPKITMDAKTGQIIEVGYGPEVDAMLAEIDALWAAERKIWAGVVERELAHELAYRAACALERGTPHGSRLGYGHFDER